MDVASSSQSVAETFLRLLRSRGIEYFYVNAGTDSPSIVEAFARHAGDDLPTPILVPHENAALGMAHGHYMVSGRPQAVMVHVNVGTANALCALINAARSNVPVFFTAGRTPLFDDGTFGHKSQPIHWAQEMFDQASMLRETVKWDYELRDGAQLEQVVDRALSVAMAEPRGPIYLSLPREVLAMPATPAAQTSRSRPPQPPRPAAEDIEAVVTMLAGARRPVVVTTASGQDTSTVPLLANLADVCALPVVEHRPRYMCFPSNHPMHAGYDSHASIADADLVIVLEADVPWIPGEASPPPGCKIVQVGNDPMFARYPMRSFPSDLTLAVPVAGFLSALSEAVSGRLDAAVVEARRERFAELKREQKARRDGGARPDGRINKAWLSKCLNEAIGQDAILVNEYWAMRAHVDRDVPGTYFSTPPAAGLGWGLPAALGAKQASPDSLVVATLGDGAYLFANPPACHQVGESAGLPVLTVVCNNGIWGAVRSATLGLYPDGAAASSNSMPLTRLAPGSRIEKYVEVSGGYGECVDRADSLPAALARAIRVVREEKRQAVLNVICE